VRSLAILAVMGALGVPPALLAAASAPPPPPTAQATAPIDLTGNWVSIVNEDWRWRMLTPEKGDYASVPLNEAGRKVADTWDRSQDSSCKAYGVGAVMRMPTRLRITWQSPDVLQIETDSGSQVRRLYFGNPPPAHEKTLQGVSAAQWQRAMPTGDGWGFGMPSPPRPGGTLRVTTSDFQAGWLRRNGVPYGETARITEFYDRFSVPDGSEWFVVTTIIEDPEYLNTPFTTSTHFRREKDSSGWHPRPCAAVPPVATIQQLMDTQVDPAADHIWDSVEFVATLAGSEDRRPRTDMEWQAVRVSAVSLLEAADLLSVPGRHVGVSSTPAAAGELDPREIQLRIDASHPAFVQFAGGLKRAAQQVVAAVDAKDAEALIRAGGVLDQACEACHATFWYPKTAASP